MVRVRLVMEMSWLKWCVEANLSYRDGWVGGVFHCTSGRNGHGDHMLAFQAAAVDARGERAGSIPWRSERIVAAFQLGKSLCFRR